MYTYLHIYIYLSHLYTCIQKVYSHIYMYIHVKYISFSWSHINYVFDDLAHLRLYQLENRVQENLVQESMKCHRMRVSQILSFPPGPGVTPRLQPRTTTHASVSHWQYSLQKKTVQWLVPVTTQWTPRGSLFFKKVVACVCCFVLWTWGWKHTWSSWKTHTWSSWEIKAPWQGVSRDNMYREHIYNLLANFLIVTQIAAEFPRMRHTHTLSFTHTHTHTHTYKFVNWKNCYRWARDWRGRTTIARETFWELFNEIT